MSMDSPRNLPKGIRPKTRTKGGKAIPVLTEDGTPVYRVRVWDPVLKRQVERTAEGLEAAKALLKQFAEAKRRPGRLTAERMRFVDVRPATSSRTRSSATAPHDPSRHSPRRGRSSTST
jgi:hypothetical protein